jgi:hypothetical protein
MLLRGKELNALCSQQPLRSLLKPERSSQLQVLASTLQYVCVRRLPLPCCCGCRCCCVLQSFLLMRLSVVRPIETRKFIAVSRQVGVAAGLHSSSWFHLSARAAMQLAMGAATIFQTSY